MPRIINGSEKVKAWEWSPWVLGGLGSGVLPLGGLEAGLQFGIGTLAL